VAEFDAVVEAQLDAARPYYTVLVFFDFQTQPVRVWHGAGDLAVMGHTWKGLGRLGQISAAGQSQAGIVEELTFRIAASEEMLERADLDAANEDTIGRDVEVWVQFLDLRPDSRHQLLPERFLYFWGRMGPLTSDRSPPDQAGNVVMSIEIAAQNALRNWSKPPFGMFSDTDQRHRASDGADAICVRIPEFVDGSVAWPQF
jgi:hypothetical protein